MVTQVKWWSHLQGRERNDNVMTSPFFLEGSYLLEICKTKFFFTNHVTLRLTKHLKITRDLQGFMYWLQTQVKLRFWNGAK